MRFVLLSFLFMGWAFYELSGGADFEPRQSGDQVALGDAPTTVAETAVAAAGIEPEPAATPVYAPETAHVTPVQPVPVAELRASDTDATDQNLSLRLNQPGAGSDGTDLRLASLADDGAAFPQPVFLTPSVSSVESAPAAPPPEPVETVADIRRISGSRVNMRRGPGTTYSVIGTLYFDDQVEVIEDPGAGWVQLRKIGDDRIGWMAARFVRESDG